LGTIRATVLLETITAAFEMEEILFHLREHSLGLNCGRWDYLFSYIKKFKLHTDKIAPDRSFLTMEIPLMQAYTQRLISICHKRGTFAMGGMSAANQIHKTAPNQIKEAQLLELPRVPAETTITSDALRKGVIIVLTYTEAWLRGLGCIPLNNAMEDAATAEISRVQIWQWRYHRQLTRDDGLVISTERIARLIKEEVERQGHRGRWMLAGRLVEQMLTGEELHDFLTTVCYPYIVTIGESGKSKL